MNIGVGEALLIALCGFVTVFLLLIFLIVVRLFLHSSTEFSIRVATNLLLRLNRLRLLLQRKRKSLPSRGTASCS